MTSLTASSPGPSLEDLLRQACLMEVSARKAGNVHPEASFADTTFQDFVASADLIAPILAQARATGVGQAILDAVRATRDSLGKNTNLGMILLLAPLAAVPETVTLADGIGDVLRKLTVRDAEFVYEAIRLARPGGLGKVERGDVQDAPQMTLLEAMTLAKDRDLIAAEYASDFSFTTRQAAGILIRTSHLDWELRVIHLHLWMLSRQPDTLIARKCGEEAAEEAQGWAQHIFAEGWPETDGSIRLFQKFDRWLRAEGNQRNPGTTADLVAGTLFVVLRDGLTRFEDWPPVADRGASG